MRNSIAFVLGLHAAFALLWNVPAYSQRITFDSPESVVVSHVTGRILVGPDPDSHTHLFNLLRKQEVQKAVGFKPSQKDAIQSWEAKSAEIIRQMKAQNQPINVISAELRSQAVEAYDEILTAEQKLRMRQIAVRIEVSVLGLATALTEGRLQEIVGVNDSQFSRINLKGAQVAERTQMEIARLLAKAEDEILQELNPDQQKVAKESLGEFFPLFEYSKHERSSRADT